MKIKIWQAFASNNSGSYTIVGSFPSPEVAEDVAQALRAVSNAHSTWLEGALAEASLDDAASPLATFARQEGLSWKEGCGTHDDWPEHGPRPNITAAGHQVLIHVDYTVSMPPTLGEYFYKRGGRVSLELNHAHAPIVATFHAWWRNDDSQVAVEATIAELTAPDGPLVTLCATAHPPAWRARSPHGMGSLELVCIFEDLCAGVAAVSATVVRHGGQCGLTVAELDERRDPMAGLRPAQPVSALRQYDVFVAAIQKGPLLRQQLAQALGTHERSVAAALDKAPGVLWRGLFEPTAKLVRNVLLAHGIEHELR